ncbi:MAG: STAS domain-containing protein [Desulfurivibrio sp.]|nr:STAS domain-containing protein [Desulfurivibrio sp.]
MQIEVSQSGDQARFSLQGILNEQGAEELKSRFNQLRLDSISEVEIDCGQVEHIGSSGIGKLLLLYKKLASKGGTLKVVNLPGPLYDLFIELKMESLFTVSRKA